MIKLIIPNEEYLRSYKEAYDEYVENNVSTYSFTDTSSCDIFAKFDRYRSERDLPPNRVGEAKLLTNRLANSMENEQVSA